MRLVPMLIVCWMSGAMVTPAATTNIRIHVLVWDERQPCQAEAYDNFRGNEIVTRLSATTEDMEFRSGSIDDPEQGLSAGNVESADVIVESVSRSRRRLT